MVGTLSLFPPYSVRYIKMPMEEARWSFVSLAARE
jgi:hypothetical protein